MIKRILSAILLFSALLSLFACNEEKIYGHAELQIALDEDFDEFDSESFDAVYTNGKAIVGIMRISFEASFNEGIPDALTPEQFARLYKTITKRDAEITFHGNTPYYEYRELQDGVENSYLASFYRSKHAYFAVIFATPTAFYPELKNEFLSLTDTVIFVYS